MAHPIPARTHLHSSWTLTILAAILALQLLGGCSPNESHASRPAGQPDPERWEEEIRRLEHDPEAKPSVVGGVLFVGSSSVRLWRSLSEDMHPLPVVRQGFGGARTADVLHYAERLVLPHRPHAIVYYAGDNDLAGPETHANPQGVRDNFRSFVETIRDAGQTPDVYFLSIKPSPMRMPHWSRMARANKLVERYASTEPGVTFVDVASRMLDSHGRPRRELYADDGVHLSAQGYALWSAILKPVLQSRVGNNPLYL